MKLPFRQERQDAPLDSDHGANEGVHDHEQRELSDVLAETKADSWHPGVYVGRRHALAFTS